MLRQSDGRVRHDGSSAAFIPGVGPVTPLSFMTAMDDPTRFLPLQGRRAKSQKLSNRLIDVHKTAYASFGESLARNTP